MKKAQFEEITAALSILIALAAYALNVKWLMWIYIVKSVFDTLCAIRAARIAVKKERLKKLEERLKFLEANEQ